MTSKFVKCQKSNVIVTTSIIVDCNNQSYCRYVLGNDLFLCGNHIYNHYKDCKEIGSYLCGDCIVDVVALYLPKASIFRKHTFFSDVAVIINLQSYRLVSLIACEGRMIRAIEHARVTLSMEVESSPTVLHIYETEDFKYILFGTVDGRVGLLDLTKLVQIRVVVN